jgi:hypothetical protein
MHAIHLFKKKISLKMFYFQASITLVLHQTAVKKAAMTTTSHCSATILLTSENFQLACMGPMPLVAW